jgi:hypothetical protein
MFERSQRDLTDRAYFRELPGGGFAAIDIAVDAPRWKRCTYRGTVTVERRVASRGAGHPAPVIATASGPTAKSVLLELLPVAQSNVAIGTALCALDRHVRRAAEPVSR